jgi:hypothetical protein
MLPYKILLHYLKWLRFQTYLLWKITWNSDTEDGWNTIDGDVLTFRYFFVLFHSQEARSGLDFAPEMAVTIKLRTLSVQDTRGERCVNCASSVLRRFRNLQMFPRCNKPDTEVAQQSGLSVGPNVAFEHLALHFVFWKSLFQVPAWRPSTLDEVSRDFPYPFSRIPR